MFARRLVLLAHAATFAEADPEAMRRARIDLSSRTSQDALGGDFEPSFACASD